MVESGKVTATRRAFDDALRALAITQHHRIWPLYLQFIRDANVPETAVRVYRRYLMVRGMTAGRRGGGSGQAYRERKSREVGRERWRCGDVEREREVERA